MATQRVIVIGGGASGLIAAAVAAGEGAETLLLERMDRPGCKLRITGKGRCNVTNVASLPDFIAHFGPNGRFLRNAFSRFFASDLVELFERLGVKLVTERGGRVFPESGEAREVADALEGWAVERGAEIRVRSRVSRLIVKHGSVTGVEIVHGGRRNRAGADLTNSGSEGPMERADAVILATGGASYPSTGSTGDGYRLAESVGHTVVPIRPALVPLITGGDVSSRLQGLALRNVNVTLYADSERCNDAFGEMIFTHFGVSGPIILTLSKHAVDAFNAGRTVSLSMDLKPALEDVKLDDRLRRDFDAHGKRVFRTLLKGLLPARLIPVCIDLTGIPPDTPANQITAEQRRRLRLWLKDFRLDIIGHRPFSEAIITAGGVSTREVDPGTMASRLVRGLFFAGELLDIDADTGGYNLQAAFSTGWIAGSAAGSFGRGNG